MKKENLPRIQILISILAVSLLCPLTMTLWQTKDEFFREITNPKCWGFVPVQPLSNGSTVDFADARNLCAAGTMTHQAVKPTPGVTATATVSP